MTILINDMNFKNKNISITIILFSIYNLKMKWNTKFNYPKSSRSNEDGMRKYLSGDEKYPSVTSILSLTKSEEDKASLELWKQRVGYKEANRIKNDASRRGTSLHS